MRRTMVLLVGAALLAAVVAPALTSPPRDSFPLSNYPMFAGGRPTEASFATAVLVLPDGTAARLSPDAIGGTDQVVQAAATVSRAVADRQADALCREIADRTDDGGSSRGDGSRIEVVTETYDTIAWFDGDERPIRRDVHADCAVAP